MFVHPNVISFLLIDVVATRVETEGHGLNSAEIKIYTDDEDIEQGFKKGQNDNIWAVHEVLSDKMLEFSVETPPSPKEEVLTSGVYVPTVVAETEVQMGVPAIASQGPYVPAYASLPRNK